MSKYSAPPSNKPPAPPRHTNEEPQKAHRQTYPHPPPPPVNALPPSIARATPSAPPPPPVNAYPPGDSHTEPSHKPPRSNRRPPPPTLHHVPAPSYQPPPPPDPQQTTSQPPPHQPPPPQVLYSKPPSRQPPPVSSQHLNQPPQRKTPPPPLPEPQDPQPPPPQQQPKSQPKALPQPKQVPPVAAPQPQPEPTQDVAPQVQPAQPVQAQPQIPSKQGAKPLPIPQHVKPPTQPPPQNIQAPTQPPQMGDTAEGRVGMRIRNSPHFQTINLKGSEGIRSSPKLRSSSNTLVKSTDTYVNDARNHPQAQFAQLVEGYAARHKKNALHTLKVTKIPFVEQAELRIKSYSSSQILESPISAGADIYTAIAYGVFGDATLGEQVRAKMVDTLRELANWLEAPNRPDLSKVLSGLTLDDLNVLFRYLVPDDANQPANGDGGEGGAGADEDEGKGKEKVTQQGMVVPTDESKKKKKKRKNQLNRDSVRDTRYARALRAMSNDITHWDDAHGNYIHPLSIIAIGSILYSRSILLFSVRSGNTVKLLSVIPPRPKAQLPVYLALDEKSTELVFMLVPQSELHAYDENQLFIQRHVMETLALVPAYNEGEDEIMRTFLSFKKECREEVQLIFFVDGVCKNGADVNHNTLQALLNHFDFVKMGNATSIARFGKDDLQGLVADVCTLDETMNATMEYVGVDRTDAVPHISIRVWIKKNNSGKKQSQLKFFEYLSKRSVQPRYLLFVDSDTRFENPAVTALKNTLDKANTGKVVPEMGGVTGEIIVENIDAGYYILGATQYFEYKMSHHLGKRAEASFGRVSCLAGAFSMFECRALMDPRVISDFASDKNEKSLWHYNKKNLGEDRYLTAQLLEAGYGTSFEPKALSSTVAPDTLRGFIAQRRRWDNSTLVNQIDLIFADKESVFSLWGGRYTLPWVWNLIDFLFTMFMPGNMVLLLVSLINSILQLSGSSATAQLAWVAPVVGLVLWGFFFLLPLTVKKPWVLTTDIWIVKGVSVLVVTATALLFAYMYQVSSIWLIVVATWVFLGPYAITLIIRKEVVCMLCGPLFLLMTPVMFLFLKFYALANFGERSWGTRGAAAAEKEQGNIQVTIGFAGVVYLLINVGYMVVAVLYPLYFMWTFAILVSINAVTRLVASMALNNLLGRYRRMLGTIAMFDGLFAVMCVILFKIMLDFDTSKESYIFFYADKSAVLFASLARAVIVVIWYMGMRRSGWIAYGLAVGVTVIEGVLICSLNMFNAYGLVLGVVGIAYTIIEGVFVWKTISPVSGAKMDDTRGLCFYLAYIHHIIFLGVAILLSFLDQSNLVRAREELGETLVPASVIVLPLAAVAGVWMWVLHLLPRGRAWVLVMHAIVCNVLFFIGLILAGELLVSSYMDSFTTGYYPYVALLSMVFQLLVSASAVRWAVHLKHEKKVAEHALTKDASVNPATGSLWPINTAV